MPTVSVLMTVYNGMPYLPTAVDSVLEQTFEDLELVIVNDGSTDGTAEYLAGVADPRIRVLTQENHGTAVAANHGLRHCTGELIARMDADDVSLPHRLATQVEFLRNHPEVGLVGAQIVPLGTAGAGPSLHLPTTHHEIYTALLDGRHGLAHSCILFRAELLRKIGGYWDVPLQDAWDMMLRMGEVAKLANIGEVLHHYRVHRGSLNGKGMRRMRLSIEFARELARRRRQNEPAMALDRFIAQRNGRSALVRAAEAIDLHARCQYRLAVAEQYGGRPVRGRLRLAWAAALAPRLTFERLIRTWQERKAKEPSGVASGSSFANTARG